MGLRPYLHSKKNVRRFGIRISLIAYRLHIPEGMYVLVVAPFKVFLLRLGTGLSYIIKYLDFPVSKIIRRHFLRLLNADFTPCIYKFTELGDCYVNLLENDEEVEFFYLFLYIL